MTVITPHFPRDLRYNELDHSDEFDIEQHDDLLWEDDYPELQGDDSQPLTAYHSTPRRTGILTTRQP